jgi:AcrR family transcriptional regulator
MSGKLPLAPDDLCQNRPSLGRLVLLEGEGSWLPVKSFPQVVRNRIVEVYMDYLATLRQDEATITSICRGCGIYRTSFYRHFEDLADLDERFLHIFFQEALVPASRPTQSLADVSHLLQATVRAMQTRPQFFLALYREPGLLQYRSLWRTILEHRFKESVDFSQLFVDVELNQIYEDLTLGAVERYLQLAFLGTTTLDLPTITAHVVAFLIGGAKGLGDDITNELSVVRPRVDLILAKQSLIRRSSGTNLN